MTDETQAQPPEPGAGFAVPATIADDAEFWRVICGMQALRQNEGTAPAEVHRFIAELVEVAAVVALRETDASFEQLTVEILRMIEENEMASLYTDNRLEYRRLYDEGGRRFSPPDRLPELHPVLRILTDPASSDADKQSAIIMDVRRRRAFGVLPRKAAFYAIGLMVLYMATDRLREEHGVDVMEMDDDESQRVVAPVAAQVAEEFGECEMADLMAADWPEFMARYAGAKTAYDAVEPPMVVQ